jgi:hypothetical protein
MTEATQEANLPRIARLAGGFYLLQMAAGVFGEVFVRGKLVVRGNPAQTAQNILESEGLFRLSIATDLVCYIAVLLAVWAFYVLLRSVDRNLALLAVLFRLMELAIHFNVTLNSVAALRLLRGDASLQSIDPVQLQSFAQFAIGMQGSGMNTGFVLLGIGSALFAYVFWKSSYIPRPLAGLGVFASPLLAAYALSIILFPASAKLGLMPMAPMGIYEIGLGLWLLIRGVKLAPGR